MTGKSECFLIYVTIIEGRQYDILNMDSVVQIRIGKQRKATAVQLSSDNPYYNEYFVFELNTSLNNLLDQQVVLTVIQPRKRWHKRKVLGHFKLDVATIWVTPGQCFYHKWVILSGDLNDKKPGTRGFLKIDIGILNKAQIAPLPSATDDGAETDDIEGNLLGQENISGMNERSRANFIFKIYNADLMKKCSLSSVYIEITFAGLKAKTSTHKCLPNIVWNEQIIFNELFPTLSQRIKIELKYFPCIPSIVYYMFLKKISNDGDNGFLPTFGPSYIYFYDKEDTDINYHGKLLLEIKTELLSDLMWSPNSIEVSPITSVPDISLSVEKYLLICNIYSTTMIHKKFKGKNICFKISLGDFDTDKLSNVSTVRKPIYDNQRIYLHLAYYDQVICLSHILELNSCRRTIYNTNMLKKIHHLLKMETEKISELFEKGSSQTEIAAYYLSVAEKLETNCRIFLNIIKNCPLPKIELDAKQMQLCIKDIEIIQENIVTIVHMTNKKKIFKILLNIILKLQCLIENVPDCWPSIIIWMLADNNRVGYYKIPASDVIHSLITEEKGISCGAVQYVFINDIHKIKENQSDILAKLGIQLWFGIYENKDQCMETISACFEPVTLKDENSIPRILTCTAINYATCRVNIFQAKLKSGADYTALSDPFVQVVVNEHILITKSIPKTLCPVWNITVIFKNIKMYGSNQFLTLNTPPVVLEIYDRDILFSKEIIGRCVLIPEVQYSFDNISTLHWVKISNRDKCTGEILVSSELILQAPTESEELVPEYNIVESIPASIKPNLIKYRMDVYFWGVHDLKKVYLRTIRKPKITIDCGGHTLHSSTLQNTRKYLNFMNPYKYTYLNIPENPEYYPPLSINMHDCRGFGYYVYIGTNLEKVEKFIYKPITNAVREKTISNTVYTKISNSLSTLESESQLVLQKKISTLEYFKSKFIKNKKKYSTKTFDLKENKENKIDFDVIDWWTKYYVSSQNSEFPIDDRMKDIFKIKIYPCELENVEEFNSFNDLLHTFKLYRGKYTGDEMLDDDYVIGKFKGNIRIWSCPEDNVKYVTETGHTVENGTFEHYPNNSSLEFVVRVYVIQAFNLRPKDSSGKSDPYIVINLGDKEIIDRDNYIPNDVNPVFGRLYELKGIFPQNNILTIALWDFDKSSPDDLIGETKIDLENRFYTNHRANCGLPAIYIANGPCAWRDQFKPSQILSKLCHKNNLGSPIYTDNSVIVGSKIFTNCHFVVNEEVKTEAMSLYVLNKWKHVPLVGCRLLPEHVETRSLHHFAKPGLEQGKLQLWIDIFPMIDTPLPTPVNIKPRVPLPYELRVIIWNTDKVILEEDSFFIGEKKSDIYVKGWLSNKEDSQSTDVHYNSISGEGNFNWRFIYPFLYLPTEDKILIKKKKSVFSLDYTENKIPCYLCLQVWDNDTFNPDDFLGTLKISLSKLPRGAKTSKLCTLDNLEHNAPTINLFKTKRHKGWWPFTGVKDGEYILAGKVEVEFELLNEEEGKNNPAGLGRAEPQGLPPPKRPDLSFFWLQSPLKSLKFLICKRFRCKIILFFLFSLIIFAFLVGLYAFPNYAVKKLLQT